MPFFTYCEIWFRIRKKDVCGFVTIFIQLRKLFCFFETNLSKKMVNKLMVSTSLFKSKAYFDITVVLSYVLYPIRFLSTGNAFFYVVNLFVSVMDNCILFYEVWNRKTKTTFGLNNTGQLWQLVFRIRMFTNLWNYCYLACSITDAAIINQFLKHFFCDRSWFLDIKHSPNIS